MTAKFVLVIIFVSKMVTIIAIITFFSFLLGDRCSETFEILMFGKQLLKIILQDSDTVLQLKTDLSVT